ncbi:hypothetical protein BDM02DRAFT_3133305, partial [Thelephora ganbajun]
MSYRVIVNAKRAKREEAIRETAALTTRELSEEEQRITSSCSTFISAVLLACSNVIVASQIVQVIEEGQWTSTQVVTVFIKLAVRAQDETNCVTEVMFSDALRSASKLDAHFTTTKELKGPLHGVLISFKDLTPVPYCEVKLGQKLKFGYYFDDGMARITPACHCAGCETVEALRKQGRERIELELPSRVLPTTMSCVLESLFCTPRPYSARHGKKVSEAFTFLSPTFGNTDFFGNKGPDPTESNLELAYTYIPRFLHVMIGWYLEKVWDAHGSDGTTSPGLASSTLIHDNTSSPKELYKLLYGKKWGYDTDAMEEMGEDEEVVEMMKVVNPALGEKGFDRDDWEKWKAIHPTDSPNLDFPNFRTGCTQLIRPHHSSLLPIVMSRVQSVARRPCNACSRYLRLAPIQGFFSSNQANQGGYPGDGDFGGEGDFGGDGRGTFVPPYPTREPNGRDLIVGMTNPDAGGGTIDCFDKNALKNWVGPECWKLRKVIQKPIGEQTTAAAPGHRREKKGAFKINFYEPLGMSGKELTKEKFAPPTQGVGINLPRHSLPSYSNSGKNRCYKTTPISRVGNRPHYSSSQTSCPKPPPT